MKQLMFKTLTQRPSQLISQSQLRTSSLLTTSQSFTYKTVVRHRRNVEYDRERDEYTAKVKEFRKQHRKEYWEAQTQVENNYLQTWREDQMASQRRALDRWRTKICNIAMHTKKQIQDLEKKEDRLLQTMTRKDLFDTKKAMENKIMLNVMQIDSRKWPTLFDLNSKIDENVVLPQTILNYGEYQQKLQNLAFYAEQGDHESMQKLLDKEDVMEKKNVLLQPLFRDLKSIIKHMTYTEEYRILKEYIDNRNLITTNFPADSDKVKDGFKLLEQEYAKLLKIHRQQLNEPGKKLKLLQQRLEDMFQLLNLWTQYVEIIYMPESEIHILSAIEKMDARPEDTSYGFKTQEKDIQRRISTLFGPDSAQKQQKEDDAAQVPDDIGGMPKRDDYETVNEGLTTDTTEGPANQDSRSSLASDENAANVLGAQGKKHIGVVEEGILSSDDENNNDKKVQKIKDTPIQNQEIKQFSEDKKAKLFEDEKTKEEIENKFNFGDQDIEQFSARIQNKAERDQTKGKQKMHKDDDDEDENKSFVNQTQYNQDEMEEMDMASLNLFGVPIEDQKDKNKDLASNQETQKILRDLINITDQLDDNLMNFNVRKSFVYYDPYEPDEAVAYAYLKFEDEHKLRASIVLDHYKQQVLSLVDDELTYADKEKKKQVLEMLKFMSNLKIIDPKVLMQLYDLYRYRV